MKKAFLFFITACALIPCLAQQTEQQRPGQTPAPDCGLPMPPIIFDSPVSQTICPGSNVTFIASAHSAGRYWQMSTDNGVTWTSVPANSYVSPFDPYQPDTLIVFSVGTNMNGYLFRCEYAGFCNAHAFTGSAALTVASSNIQVSSQPQNISTCKYTSADFTIGHTGSSLSYQWQVSTNGGADFSDMPGKKMAALHFDSVSLAMDNNQYRCVISSECAATVVSSPATLTVINESTAVSPIFYNPTCYEDTAFLHVTATGNNLAYQWKCWDYYGHLLDMQGETSSTIAVPFYGNRPSNNFLCTVTSTCKTLNTPAVDIYYEQKAIPVPAEDKYACTGDEITLYSFQNFSSVRSNPHFQWQYSIDGGVNYNNLAGDTLDHLSITGTASINNYKYRCYLNSACFTGYSNIKTVHMNVPAAIITQPENKKGCIGFPVVFHIQATGSIYGYHWEESNDGGNSYTRVSDSQFPSYTIYNLTSAKNNYKYRCKISSNCFDTIVSIPVTLQVYSNPEAGRDTTVNVNCDTCTTDIIPLHATAGFASILWGTANPQNTKAGKYKLVVFNSNGCYDTAWNYVNALVADTLRICPNGMAQLTAPVTGSNYQWQVDYGYGQGFGTVSDAPYSYSGSTTTTLTINRINDNILVRSIVDGNIARTYVVQYTAFWTGLADSDWNNPLNWSCGEVPDLKTEVIIDGNAPHSPEIKTNIGCKKLTVRHTQVTVLPGRGIGISGGN